MAAGAVRLESSLSAMLPSRARPTSVSKAILGPVARTTISVVWGTSALPGRTREVTRWYRELLESLEGATTEDVVLA